MTEDVMRPKIIYFAAVGDGGLAKYAVRQAAAISEVGCDVVFLGRPNLQQELRQIAPQVEFVQLVQHGEVKGKIGKIVRAVRNFRSEVEQLESLVVDRRVEHVMISTYVEYFSPFWAGRLRRMHATGTRFAVVVHDPVRDYRIGPTMWHRWSVSMAYSYIDVAFVHDNGLIDTGWPHRKIETMVIPMGRFDLRSRPPTVSRAAVRKSLGIPADATVMLSFGHIRDGKRLDLTIQTLRFFPSLHLLVVGREQSGSQRPVSFYRELAVEHGVADRCHWVHDFVPDDEVAQYFYCADVVSILYSSAFQSASAVLSTVAEFEVPVLASSGGGSLQRLVKEYGLGVWVPPDDIGAIQSGLARLLREFSGHSPDWRRFREEQSWECNAMASMSALLGNAFPSPLPS